jgi:flagellar operon protein
LSPISNPALVPPGGLAAPATPVRQGAKTPTPGAPGAPGVPGVPGVPAAPGQSGSFADALSRAGGVAQAGQGQQLNFSKHALARVERRGIDLDANTLGRLSQGVQRAASNGSRDSLVLVDGTAFVVSVSNRTVITAVGSEHMKDNVFTNIDSAVIA